MSTRFPLATLTLIGLCAGSSAFAPAPVYKEPPTPKVPPLSTAMQGTWQLDNSQAVRNLGRRGGLGFQRTTAIRIQGTEWQYVFTTNGVEQHGIKYQMVLDPKQSPATLDLKNDGAAVMAAAAVQVALKGIVKVEGDTLTFCYVSGYQENAVRPGTFVPGQVLPNGTTTMVMTLKKLK